MVSAAAEFARKKPTSNWTAYDFFLQGRELSNLGLEKEAVPLFERATAIIEFCAGSRLADDGAP